MRARIKNDILRRHLGSLIDKANILMHASDRSERKSKKVEVIVNEKEVLDYLRAIKSLVEKAPDQINRA